MKDNKYHKQMRIADFKFKQFIKTKLYSFADFSWI